MNALARAGTRRAGLFAAIVLTHSVAQAQTVSVSVLANQLLNGTGILAGANQTFAIAASGVTDISNANGGYRTGPNGVLTETPTGTASTFFRDNAAPAGVVPVAGAIKTVTAATPGALVGAPFGGLVAGFTLNPTPTTLADFASGFRFVGSGATIAAPSTGGYLFLAVNDWSAALGDNSGSFAVRITATPEPASVALVASGALLLGVGALGRRRRR